MKTKLITILALSLCLFTACSDDIVPRQQTQNQNTSQADASKIDSVAIYKSQTSKATILTNMVRNQSGKYVLDLTEGDAETLGISSEQFRVMKQQVEQLNSHVNQK